MPKRKPPLTPESFVERWQRSKSTREVADFFGVTRLLANARAHYYRKQGIPLKSFPGRGTRLDVDKLKEIAEKNE